MGLETPPADSVDRWLLEQLAQPGGAARDGRMVHHGWVPRKRNQWRVIFAVITSRGIVHVCCEALPPSCRFQTLAIPPLGPFIE